jgi:glucose-1-phosphate thymidylyltransferase
LDAILLAGGYATRLYPLTKNRPKALLPLGGRAILDHLVDMIDGTEEVDRMFLVTNARFADHFEQWSDSRKLQCPLQVLNDGTTSNETRLGAIGDVKFVLDNTDVRTSEGVYVMATDNVPQFDPTAVVRLSRRRGASAVFASRCPDPKRLLRMGVATLDEEGRVVEFEEKPDEPKSDLVVPPFYAYSPEAVELLERYLAEGNNPDAPGHFIAWLVPRRPVYAHVTEESVLDIGTLESYRAACERFGSEPPACA